MLLVQLHFAGTHTSLRGSTGRPADAISVSEAIGTTGG